MKRYAFPGLACALGLAVVGCGPMTTPLPPRLEGESLHKVEEGWERAFTPVGRFDHQGLLDVMVGCQAYQMGVDTFALRAEKKLAAGKVVMEIAFDRARPNDDRFVVTVHDVAGKVVRAERYGRAEVEATFADLFQNQPQQKGANQPEAPPAAAKRATFEARWERIRQVFPADQPPAKPNG